MKPSLLGHVAVVRVRCLVVIAILASGLTGCVSAKYKRAERPTEPQPLNLAAKTPELEAYVQSLIVYGGPGSWKKEAYWDEYVLSLVNRGDAGVVIDSAALVDALDHEQSPGTDPWELEEVSRANLKKYEHYGSRILLGAGLGAVWTLSPAAAYAAAWTGSSALAWLSVTTFFAIPAAVIGHVVVTHNAKKDLAAEFNHRRLPLPLTVLPHAVRNGSLFFPISPGPKRLHLKGRLAEAPFAVTIDLTPLAGLHFVKEPAPGKSTTQFH